VAIPIVLGAATPSLEKRTRLTSRWIGQSQGRRFEYFVCFVKFV
jgi:hypothetical protein